MIFKPVEKTVEYEYNQETSTPSISMWGVRETDDHPVGICVNIYNDLFSLEFTLDAKDVEAALERGKSFDRFRM